MATEQTFLDWATEKKYRLIAAELVRLEVERAAFDLSALGEDPEGALQGDPEVTVEYDTNPKAGCSVFGYYRFQPTGQSMILVHPALTSERDSFTILHELGHHVQRQHVEWANVRHSFPGEAGGRLEERVADAFAAEVLIPADSVSPDASWLSARTLSEIYGKVRASRAAVAMRAVEIAPDQEQATVVVTDHQGIVTFARACGDDVFAPARGRIQPGIARLIAKALDSAGDATGDLSEGLQSISGWAQHELTADVSLDHTWAYAFTVIRPARRYGRRTVWNRPDDYECPREACGHVFTVNETIVICPDCNTPKCPNCNGCVCEPKPAPVCENCWLELTISEQQNPALHECP